MSAFTNRKEVKPIGKLIVLGVLCLCFFMACSGVKNDNNPVPVSDVDLANVVYAQERCPYETRDTNVVNGITVLSSTGQPVNGVVCYNSDGMLLWETPYKNGMKDGIEKYYDVDGKLEKEHPYKNGTLEGIARNYDESGKVISEISYRNNVPILPAGRCQYKYDDVVGANGKMVLLSTKQPVNGVVCIIIDAAIVSEAPYKNGKMEGIQKFYNLNGTLESEFSYKNGIQEGIGRMYYESGKLMGAVIFRDGVREGIQSEYYESGKLFWEVLFKNGKMDGTAKSYYESGKLRMEIPYKNALLSKTALKAKIHIDSKSLTVPKVAISR